MSHITTSDGVGLFVEETGCGSPIIFVHEFAGDHLSWEPQVRYFSRRHRCITYNARGFPPSDVPTNLSAYSQSRACNDIRDVLDGLGIAKAHVVGLSMGGFATLHFGLTYPERALSLLVAGCGYGAERDQRERFRAEADATAALLRKGIESFAERYAVGPARVQFKTKDPRGWQEFAERLSGHSAEGAALTQEGVQKERPSIFDLEAQLSALTVPLLIMTGDEDFSCHAPNIFMKRVVSSSGLVFIPNTGHTVNLEEPDLFNLHLDRFVAQVESGRWYQRDHRTRTESISGIEKDT